MYYFRKYDVSTVQFTTGYSYILCTQWLVRKEDYNKKRDKTFDFMQIGVSDYEEYTDDFV